MPARKMTSEEVAELLHDSPGFEEGRRTRQTIFDLGDKLRELRKSFLGISQKEAAQLIGIEQPELSRIETGMGKRGPSFTTITRIITAYQAHLRETGSGLHVALSISISCDDSEEVVLSHLTTS